MTLQELAQIGAVVGGAGVIVSFFYVAIQIRNNTRAVRAATFQQVATTFSNVYFDLARSADLCSLVVRGGDDFDSLDRIEKARFRFNLTGFFRCAESVYFHGEMRTIAPETWLGIRENLKIVIERPGARAAWELIKNRFNPEFRDFVDGLAPSPQAAATPG